VLHIRLAAATAMALACAPIGAAERGVSDDWGGLELLNAKIAPGTAHKTSFMPYRSFEGGYLDTAVWAARGARPGPTLCVVAGIHGDEINSAEIARRVFASTKPESLSGTLVVVPAANAFGYRTGNRYMPDRRDLNRSFPGSRDGSVASLVAHEIFTRVIRSCGVLVDLHTGSFFRTNLPQVRVDLSHARALEIARHFGVGIVLGGAGPRRSLRREAMEIGIPAVIYEAGEPHRFQPEEIERGVHGVFNVMGFLGMIPPPSRETPLARVYRRSSWVRVPVGRGGAFFPGVALGAHVERGDVLGNVTSPDDDEPAPIRAPYPGTVIGMAVPSITLSGYGVFHIGRDPQPGSE
jgi:predicted deacylase